MLGVCIVTQLTAIAAVVLPAAPYMAILETRDSHFFGLVERTLTLAPVGIIVLFVPTMVYAVMLTAFSKQAICHNWGAWTRYACAAALTVAVFFAFISRFSRPITHFPASFDEEFQSVQRPAITAAEVPLLAISIVAGLVGARACAWSVRNELKPQQEVT
jgi:hypothetical protein